MSCTVKCRGFSSLRAECIASPCLGDNGCYMFDPSLSTSRPCSDWCCQSNSGIIFLLILLVCAVTFLCATAYWLRRLHGINVKSGAVEERKKAQGGDAVPMAERKGGTPSAAAATAKVEY